jgi:pyruvate decarboxylase
MLDFFGASDGAARTHQARTKVELEAILTTPEFEDPKGVHVSVHIAVTLPLLFSPQI